MSQVKILLIDDDLLVAKSLKNLLVKQGYLVFVANNGDEAIVLAEKIDFDAVVSDIRMPGQNGIVCIQKIKELYSERRIDCAFILITGYVEEDTPAHAIRLGVNKFLLKPFENETLLKSIEEEISFIRIKKAEIKSREPKELNQKSRKIPEYRRVVITGFGVVAPNGIGCRDYWNSLKEGKNCVVPITCFDSSDFPAKAAAETKFFNPSDFIDDKSQIKRMGRSSHLAVAGAQLAVRDAALEITNDLIPEIGVILGSAVPGLEYVEVDFRALERSGVRKVRPYLGIAGFGGAISSEISRALGVRGPSITISTGCTSSTDAMGYPFDLIQNGKAKLLITGGQTPA